MSTTGEYSAPAVRSEGSNATTATFTIDIASSEVTCFHDNVTYVVRVVPLPGETTSSRC